MTDEDLRERLASWARPIESAQIPAIEVISGRARRRVRRMAAAWAAGTALGCIGLAVALAGLAPGHVTITTGWRPPGTLPGAAAGPATAPYFVMLDLQR